MDSHELGLTIEEKLGGIYTRLQQQVVLNQQGQRSETSAEAAYFAEPGIAAIGGLRYQVNDRGEKDFIPEVGLQVDKVPLTVGDSSRDQSVMIRLMLPLGR